MALVRQELMNDMPKDSAMLLAELTEVRALLKRVHLNIQQILSYDEEMNVLEAMAAYFGRDDRTNPSDR